MTDARLKELAGLTGLESLMLCQTKVTDAGLKELGGLIRLQSLAVVYRNVTDAGLKELSDLKMQALDFRGTQVWVDRNVYFLKAAIHL